MRVISTVTVLGSIATLTGGVWGAQVSPIYPSSSTKLPESVLHEQPVSIDSEAAAIALAMKLFGCEVITPQRTDADTLSSVAELPQTIPPTAIRHRADSDATPFLSGTIVGSWVWDVELPNVAIAINTKSGLALSLQAKKVKVRLSATNGDLISILFESEVADGTEQELAPYPDAKMAAEYIGRGGEEVWHALVGQPKLSLADALGCIHTQFGLGKFQEIRAHCVMWSMMRQARRPAWSVHVRGLDASQDVESSTEAQQRLESGKARFSELGEPLAEESTIPLSLRNHLRHVVFDDTGEWYTAGTTPQPARLLDSEMKKVEELLKQSRKSTPVVTAPSQGGK